LKEFSHSSFTFIHTKKVQKYRITSIVDKFNSVQTLEELAEVLNTKLTVSNCLHAMGKL